ncbi:MAG: response regulator [Deltaproteobacteria bacterium]|nr:response regulator [Deltaproteobacteria bacterium]
MLFDHEIFKAKLLIVDDNPVNVRLLESIAKKAGYNSVRTLTDPRAVRELYLAYQPDLVVLDIIMPYLDGFQVMAQLQGINQDSYLSVLVITAQQDEETRLRALEYGAQDFLTKPFNRLEVTTKIRNMARIRLLHNEVKNQNIILENKVRQRTLELHDTRLEIIRRLGQAAEYRDNDTGLHIVRMSRMCAVLAGLAGLAKERVELLLNTSPMHDVGKIGIPDKIMLKPDKLDADEWRVMTTHTTIGAKLLAGHDSELMVAARLIALNHHEKWDGGGYPHGLRGVDIPVEGRIAALADTFDALTSRRPYKDPYPVEFACKIIKNERGGHFDPELTDLFLANIDAFAAIKNEFSAAEDVATGNYKLSARDVARNFARN